MNTSKGGLDLVTDFIVPLMNEIDVFSENNCIYFPYIIFNLWVIHPHVYRSVYSWNVAINFHQHRRSVPDICSLSSITLSLKIQMPYILNRGNLTSDLIYPCYL